MKILIIILIFLTPFLAYGQGELLDSGDSGVGGGLCVLFNDASTGYVLFMGNSMYQITHS